MTGSGWQLVDLASRFLERDEREVVLGDIAESGSSSSRALWDVLGLVVRRQVAWWGDWRPWLTLFVVVFPLGLLLSIVSRSWAEGAAGTIRLNVNHWGDWNYFSNPGLQRYLVGLTSTLLLQYTALICWSWTCGIVLGSISRGTAWMNGVVFIVLVFGGTVGTTTGRAHPFDGVENASRIAALIPVVIRCMTVVLPLILGLRRAKPVFWSPVGKTAIWSILVTALTVLTVRHTQAALFFGWRMWPPNDSGKSSMVLHGQWLPGPDGMTITGDDVLGWPLQILPFLLLVPVAWLLASATWHRWHRSVPFQ